MPKQAINSPHKTIVLNKLQFQGKSNDCGPTTTATVINALKNSNLEAKTLAKVMNKPRRRGLLIVVRRVPNWATFPWGMADVFREYGLRSSWRFKASPEEIKADLAEGQIVMPVIGSWRPLWAHVMTLLAWTPENRWGFANTQYEQHELYWLSDQVFQQRWRAMGRLVIQIKT